MKLLAAPAHASFHGRYTFAHHLRAAMFDSAATGVLLLNEFVARKALGASALEITLLLMLPSVAQILNLYWTGIGGREPRAVFLWVGIPARLALVAIGFVGGATTFVLLCMVASTAATVLIPAQNALYQANYAAHERGRLFARVSAAAAAVTILVSALLGVLYDRSETSFRLAYPVAGILATLGSIGWYRIRWRRRPDEDRDAAPASPAPVASVPRLTLGTVQVRLARGLLEPFRAARRLFAEDRDFLRFELAFMTYGLAFMMLQPVLPLYLVDDLKVDYAQAAHAKGLLFYACNIALLPLAGSLNDRFGSLRVASFSFLLLAAFPLLLIAGPRWLAGGSVMAPVYLAYAVFGAAMAGVNVTWTLGPLAMAGAGRAERYMGAHVSLVGIRGLLGYPLGMALMRIGTARLTFAAAAVLEILAAALMWSLVRRRGAR
jgi:MFS family permease